MLIDALVYTVYVRLLRLCISTSCGCAICLFQCAQPSVSFDTHGNEINHATISGQQSRIKSKRHAKLKRLAKIATLGALTGGLFGVVIGGSVAGHAVMGAATRTGIEVVHPGRFFKKHKHKLSNTNHTSHSAEKQLSKQAQGTEILR